MSVSSRLCPLTKPQRASQLMLPCPHLLQTLEPKGQALLAPPQLSYGPLPQDDQSWSPHSPFPRSCSAWAFFSGTHQHYPCGVGKAVAILGHSHPARPQDQRSPNPSNCPLPLLFSQDFCPLQARPWPPGQYAHTLALPTFLHGVPSKCSMRPRHGTPAFDPNGSTCRNPKPRLFPGPASLPTVQSPGL